MKEMKEIIQNNYLVYVQCNTYNHSNFIKDTLNGFALQETKYPFACVVMDDYSTDGTPAIIKDWIKKECDDSSISYRDTELANVYFAQHLKNSNCHFFFYFLKQNLYADSRKVLLFKQWRDCVKYEAICEGDDYWTYPFKLQEQIDFLETNDFYSATSSNSFVLRSTSTPMIHFGSEVSKDFYKLNEITVKRKFHTASVVYRISAMKNCPCYQKGGWDTFMWCCLLTQGPIHYDGKVTCVYRKQQQGVTETTRGIDWISRMSEWADIIIDCFVPKYVQRRYVVRSITREIVEVAFIKNVWRNSENRSQIKMLYRHNFSIWNVPNDLKEVVKQCAKKVLRRKTPNSGYYQ